MPTKVERCYEKLKIQGKGKAARICQAATGQALGKPRGKK